MLLANSALTCWLPSEQRGLSAGRMYSGKTLASEGGTSLTREMQAERERTAQMRTEENASNSITILKEGEKNGPYT